MTGSDMTKKKLTLAFDSGAPAPTTRRASKRVSKREAILDEAASLFNAHGIGAVSLADVAQKLGVGRATLYHYVVDRQDLDFQCFQRSCEAETERLDIAAEESDGLSRILRYVSESMSADAAEAAVITDLSFLASDAQPIIAKARLRNHQRLAGMIEQGVEAGELRRCDEQIVARVLPGMISFGHLAKRWIDPKAGPVDPAALADFLAYGSAADPHVEFECNLDVDTFNRLKAATFDRQSHNDMRIEQILMTGSRLLNERGVDGVSLEDVAASLGATRGAVYHYFTDKEDLLRRCYERGNDLYEAFIDAAEAHGRNGLEKNAIVSHLNSQAQAGALQPMAAWMGLEALSPAQQQRHRQRLRALLARNEAFALEGVADGSRRDHDVHSVSIARAGAYMWIPKWISEIEPTTPRRLADEIVALFNKGLARR